MCKKILIFGLLIVFILNINTIVNAYTVSKISNSSVSSAENIYNNDLCMVEKYLFKKTFTKENNLSRISRIEYELFNRTYQSMSFSNRMNNILTNYQNKYTDNNYYTYQHHNYYRPNNNLKNRIINNIVGQPTGYTPPLNSPYVNQFGPSYSRGFYGSNGWGYHNSYHPTVSGMGIHILD